jgi:hypothetical protein
MAIRANATPRRAYAKTASTTPSATIANSAVRDSTGMPQRAVPPRAFGWHTKGGLKNSTEFKKIKYFF